VFGGPDVRSRPREHVDFVGVYPGWLVIEPQMTFQLERNFKRPPPFPRRRMRDAQDIRNRSWSDIVPGENDRHGVGFLSVFPLADFGSPKILVSDYMTDRRNSRNLH